MNAIENLLSEIKSHEDQIKIQEELCSCCSGNTKGENS